MAKSRIFSPRSSLPPKFASSPRSGARMTEDLPVQVAGAQPGCDDEWAELRVARARFVEAHLVDQFFENQRIVGEKVHAPFPVVETDRAGNYLRNLTCITPADHPMLMHQ